ncbi:uncharacterized protein LOC135358293 isoform X2 [Latimeria chalumnae]|uniref:uncharacterized protein LOC135358293 isoform X2 n=1 Tax=Latimeria chalumnae TaxID=7897 RepID=UPI00313BF5EB
MGNLLLQFEANSKDGIKDLLRYNLGTKFTDEGCISVTECPSFVQIRLKDVTREGEDLYWVKAVRGQSHTILKRILVTVVNYIIASVGTDATFCVDIIKYTAVEMFRKENGSYKYIAAYMNPIVTPVKDEYEERFTVENGSLVLQKVQPNDTGRYRLKLNHHTEFTREIELTVTGPQCWESPWASCCPGWSPNAGNQELDGSVWGWVTLPWRGGPSKKIPNH